MNHTTKRIVTAALVLVLVLSLAACAAPTEPQTTAADPKTVLQGIYDTMLAQDSKYAELKATYLESNPNMAFTETLGDDRITVDITGSDFADGSRDFVLEGDYLTSTYAADDFMGAYLTMQMMGVVGQYLGMDPQLTIFYLSGLAQLELESDNLLIEQDETANTTTYKFKVNAPYDMKELDQMVIDRQQLALYDPLGEDSTNLGFNLGKIGLYLVGSKSDCTIVISEYGALDNVALESLRNAVDYLRPDGSEDFLANYNQLQAVETDSYQVSLAPDADVLADFGLQTQEARSYMRIHFGN